MRQMRAYLAGAGVSTTLVLAALAAFVAIGSTLSFSDWSLPGLSDDEDSVSIADPDRDRSAEAGKARLGGGGRRSR